MKTVITYDKLDEKDDLRSLIADHDEEEECLSRTEIGEDEERCAHRPKESRWKKNVKRVKKVRWLIDMVLILVNISLSILLLQAFRQERSTSSMQVGSNYMGTGPDFPTKIVKFNADEAFVPKNTTEIFSDTTLATWNSMMPAGAGWDSVKGDTFFTTTMTHQLHCVFMMTRIYANLVDNKRERLPEDYHSHYLHCVDYLRQGIMCSADLTMEPHSPSDADDNGPLDGSWNGHHVCKDYGHVIPYLEEQIYEGIRTVLPIDD